MAEKLSFEEWMEQLRKVAKAEGFMAVHGADEYYSDSTDGWREYWEDDYSPAEAVAEDCSYWQD